MGMNYALAATPPLCILAFLAIFAGILLPWQSRSTADKGLSTDGHSDRLYKDYDLYLKATLALLGGFGYVYFGGPKDPPPWIEFRVASAPLLVAAVALLVMCTISIFVICHLGSKLRRWKSIEWPKAFFWQELWACISMWLLSSGIWVCAVHISG